MNDLERLRRHKANHLPENVERRRVWRSRRSPQQITRDTVNVRKSHLQRRYGITLEDYETMLLTQGGGCAICGATSPGGRGVFQVDHNHTTGQIRGLLCYNCNRALGHAHDDPRVLKKMLEYLA